MTIEFTTLVVPFIFMTVFIVDASIIYVTHSEMYNVARTLRGGWRRVIRALRDRNTWLRFPCRRHYQSTTKPPPPAGGSPSHEPPSSSPGIMRNVTPRRSDHPAESDLRFLRGSELLGCVDVSCPLGLRHGIPDPQEAVRTY